MLHKAFFDITCNNLYLDWIADSNENSIKELKEYKQNKNFTSNIFDIIILGLAIISKTTIVLCYPNKEVVKSYIFKPLDSESKTVIELAFINGHFDLVVDKAALPVTTERKPFWYWCAY